MRRIIGTAAALFALTVIVLSGCAGNAPPTESSAPKSGSSSTAPAAKPSPSPNDPAIKPPTKEGK